MTAALIEEVQPRMAGPDRLITRAEAAALLKVSPRTIDRYADGGRLTRRYLGRLVRFRERDVLALAAPDPRKDT